MTDRGIKVRWTTAALVAPAAAALFTGATVWASGHQPATASTPKAAAPMPTPTVDPLVVSLQSAVDANTAQVAKLRATVASLQAQAAAIAKGGAVKVSTTSSGSRTWTSTKSSSSRSTSTKSKSTSSSTKKSTSSAPAPASNGSTGASPAK